MAIKNYTTKISHEKTVMEILKVLAGVGATNIAIGYDHGLPISITFCVKVGGKLLPFRLPANAKGIFERLKNDSKVPKNLKTEEQALRVVWRIIKDWVSAQVSLIEAEVVKLEEVFLPYAVMNSGRTLYQEVSKSDEFNLPEVKQ